MRRRPPSPIYMRSSSACWSAPARSSRAVTHQIKSGGAFRAKTALRRYPFACLPKPHAPACRSACCPPVERKTEPGPAKGRSKTIAVMVHAPTVPTTTSATTRTDALMATASSDRRAVCNDQHVLLVPLTEANAVECGRGDEEGGRQRRADQGNEVGRALHIVHRGETVRERHRQKERKQDLHPRQDDTKLVGQLDQLAVKAAL